MQATVRSHDPTSRSGTVLLDDGVELPYDSDAFATSQLRLLRLGQRVRVRLNAGGTRVVALTIATLPES